MSFLRPPRGEEEISIWRERITRLINRDISIKPVTSDYTIQSVDNRVIADGSANTVTVTLPEANRVKGKTFGIKCIDATFTVAIATKGAEELDGTTDNLGLLLHEAATVVSDGTNWWTI